PQVRPLPSPGVTRLPRYYEPVRHPTAARPLPRGWSVGSQTHRWGFPCLRRCPVQTCRRHYPGGTPGGIGSFPGRLGQRPSPLCGRVGSHIVLFEACSAFTQVTACLLAEPLKRSFPSKASTSLLPPSPLRLLPAGTTVAGWD